jgi:hypothetical protein
VYNYRSTSIYTIDGQIALGERQLLSFDALMRKREFDYKKRAGSGYLIGPSVIDRVFMFEPHHPSVTKTKIEFITY